MLLPSELSSFSTIQQVFVLMPLQATATASMQPSFKDLQRSGHMLPFVTQRAVSKQPRLPDWCQQVQLHEKQSPNSST